MALCINQSGTYRNIATLCINQSGTYRNTGTGCINQSGTYRNFGFLAVGCAYAGGILICKQAPNLRWVASPCSAGVCRSWYSRGDSNTCAQSVSGCTGWFVPTFCQLKNPGCVCAAFWAPPAVYWSDTQYPHSPAYACLVNLGGGGNDNKTCLNCVRSFRCVTY